MPAKELSQKIHDATMEYASFLAEVHRMLNEIEGIGVGTLNSASNMLITDEPPIPIVNTVATLTSQESTRLREAIQKLRTYMTI